MSSPIRSEKVFYRMADLSFEEFEDLYDTQYSPRRFIERRPTGRKWAQVEEIPYEEGLEHPELVMQGFFLFDPHRNAFCRFRKAK